MAVNKTLFALGDIVTATTDAPGAIRKGDRYEVVMVKQLAVALGAVYAEYHVVSLTDGARTKVRNGHLTFTK